MGIKRERTFWGAYDIDLENEIKDVQKKLEKVM